MIHRGPDQTGPFSDQIRLKQGMFQDHMPSSYTAVFTGLGADGATIPLEVLDFDENSNQMLKTSPEDFPKISPAEDFTELAKAFSEDESGYSSLG